MSTKLLVVPRVRKQRKFVLFWHASAVANTIVSSQKRTVYKNATVAIGISFKQVHIQRFAVPGHESIDYIAGPA